jgi:hypothetical protein
MKRRKFITLLGGAAAAWPFAARAQQPERLRHIGVLVPGAANDPVWQARIGAFQQALALSGWIIGRNVRIDIRWATTDAATIRREAEELAALAPDVTLAATSFHHQPEAQHPNFSLSASWQADYPIYRRQLGKYILTSRFTAYDPNRSSTTSIRRTGFMECAAAGITPA